MTRVPFCSGVHAERVLLRHAHAPTGTRTREAFGVMATNFVLQGGGVGGHKWHIAVRAPVVVSSAGSIHSPALLLRSDIDVNGNVGRNLRLHPGTLVNGIFEEVWNPNPSLFSQKGCLLGHVLVFPLLMFVKTAIDSWDTCFITPVHELVMTRGIWLTSKLKPRGITWIQNGLEEFCVLLELLLMAKATGGVST
jgi:hypothetical protein